MYYIMRRARPIVCLYKCTKDNALHMKCCKFTLWLTCRLESLDMCISFVVITPQYQTPLTGCPSHATKPPHYPLYPPNCHDPGIKGNHRSVLFPTRHRTVAAATRTWQNQPLQGVLAGRPLNSGHLIGISRLPCPS